MQLHNLSKSWSSLSLSEKLAIVQSTNERREEAFQIKIQRRTAKKSITKKRAKQPKGVKDTAALIAGLSEEDKKNLMMLIETKSKS